MVKDPPKDSRAPTYSKQGLVPGDQLISMGDQLIRTRVEFEFYRGKLARESKLINVIVIRGGEELRLALNLSDLQVSIQEVIRTVTSQDSVD